MKHVHNAVGGEADDDDAEVAAESPNGDRREEREDDELGAERRERAAHHSEEDVVGRDDDEDRWVERAFPIESVGGFELSLEITVKAYRAGFRIAEVPTTWRDRTAGASQFKFYQWLPKYLYWYFLAFRTRSRKRATTHA